MPKGTKKAKGMRVVIVVLPPDRQGFSKWLMLDPNIPPAVAGYQIATEVQKLMRKMVNKEEPEVTPTA